MRGFNMKRLLFLLAPTLGLLWFGTGLALADDATFLAQSNANITWTLLGGVLVMFMQPGFALVECGLSRAKNAANILMKNFADFMIGCLAFLFVGFGLMFGSSEGGIFGSSFFFINGLNDGSTPATQWGLTFWFFQSVFCGTAATIVSGAIAGRTKFAAYLFTSLLISVVIYPISGHWAWNALNAGANGGTNGWLGDLGFIDFAGSSVVHSVGGFVAMAGAIVVGPRLGKYSPDGVARAIPGHNLAFTALGVFILWFAWFGFNCGSTNVPDGTIGYIAVNTNVAACAGFLGAMLASWYISGKSDPSMSFNGVLAGLVGITAGCYDVNPFGAVIIGFLSGILVVASVLFIDQKLKIDDPVGAVSVHGVCGFFGSVSVGLFAAPTYGSDTLGLFYGGGLKALGVQTLGAVSIGLWAFVMGLVIFKIVKAVIGLRVDPKDEIKGLDLTEHRTEAYSGFQFFSNN
ncbi:MAG: ammonium transporter [Deltaproteobacteria bacterium]|jgi:Amt family ammonium transporter|nr:ammonium transporter [Deltaproteobacteria bacterium]